MENLEGMRFNEHPHVADIVTLSESPKQGKGFIPRPAGSVRTMALTDLVIFKEKKKKKICF